jgi:hypothetical protein
MYHPAIPDLHQQRYDDKQQQQHVYGQLPSSSSQSEFFGSHSNPPSFPSTPDFAAQTFGIPATNSPHWPPSPPPSTHAGDGQVPGSDMNSWSYVTNSPLVQRYSSTGSAHDASSAASPAAFDQQQQQQAQTSVPGAYAQPSSYDGQQQQQQRAESEYFRRSSNASYTDPPAFSPSPHLASFQPHQQQLPPTPQQQPQQFYDPSAHAHAHPAYFTDMRLSSSHSTSSAASSALSEHNWSAPTYEESPFVHHPPDDNLIAGGGVIGTPGSYTNEPLPLPVLDPLSLHDYEAYEQSQPQQASQQFQQPQQSYFQQQHHAGSPYSTGNFTASSEHLDMNGNVVNGSPLVSAQQSQHRQASSFGGPGIVQQQASVQQHPHPYGNMGQSDSTSSLHSLHSQASVHSLHSQASQHSLHNQYQHQQPQPQQGSFPALSNLAGVLPSPPHPGLSSSAAPLGAGGAPGPTAGGGGVTGMLGGIPGHIAVMHTDDANSKETQFLRRRCFNCRTTDPPSWRRSTLNTGKIVSNLPFHKTRPRQSFKIANSFLLSYR